MYNPQAYNEQHRTSERVQGIYERLYRVALGEQGFHSGLLLLFPNLDKEPAQSTPKQENVAPVVELRPANINAAPVIQAVAAQDALAQTQHEQALAEQRAAVDQALRGHYEAAA